MATEAAVQDELRKLYDKLETLLREDDPAGAPANLAAAHSADFSIRRHSKATL